jgi:methionyl aminopeptidase
MIKSKDDIRKMRAGGIITAGVMTRLMAKVQPGVNVLELNSYCAELLSSLGAAPSVKGYKGFPGNLCISINDEIIHGIPKDRLIQSGDLVSLDLVVRYAGFHTDTATTVLAGDERQPLSKALINTTEMCLTAAIKQVKPGNTLKDIAHAVHSTAVLSGISPGVVRGYGGHGIGRQMHEAPHIPNVSADADDFILQPGMTIAIEPMLTLGEPEYSLDADGWTIRTKDGKSAAHFEHTVLVTETGCEVLTRRQ